jgi:hypothetical protein
VYRYSGERIRKGGIIMRWTIFRPVEGEKKGETYFVKTAQKREKRWHFIHVLFKVKFFIPLVRYVDKKFGWAFVKERSDIPDEPYNQDILLLWDAFEEGIVEWNRKFSGMTDKLVPDDAIARGEEAIKAKKVNWYLIPKFFMKMYVTILLEDTAYREQFHVLLYKTYEKMLQAHHPDKPIIHPMYTVIYDNYLPYFIEWTKLKGISCELNLKITAPEVYTPGNPSIDIRELYKFGLEMEEQIKNERARRELEESTSSKSEQGGTVRNNEIKNGGENKETGNVQGSCPSEICQDGENAGLPGNSLETTRI